MIEINLNEKTQEQPETWIFRLFEHLKKHIMFLHNRIRPNKGDKMSEHQMTETTEQQTQQVNQSEVQTQTPEDQEDGSKKSQQIILIIKKILTYASMILFTLVNIIIAAFIPVLIVLYQKGMISIDKIRALEFPLNSFHEAFDLLSASENSLSYIFIIIGAKCLLSLLRDNPENDRDQLKTEGDELREEISRLSEQQTIMRGDIDENAVDSTINPTVSDLQNTLNQHAKQIEKIERRTNWCEENIGEIIEDSNQAKSFAEINENVGIAKQNKVIGRLTSRVVELERKIRSKPEPDNVEECIQKIFELGRMTPESKVFRSKKIEYLFIVNKHIDSFFRNHEFANLLRLFQILEKNISKVPSTMIVTILSSTKYLCEEYENKFKEMHPDVDESILNELRQSRAWLVEINNNSNSIEETNDDEDTKETQVFLPELTSEDTSDEVTLDIDAIMSGPSDEISEEDWEADFNL